MKTLGVAAAPAIGICTVLGADQRYRIAQLWPFPLLANMPVRTLKRPRHRTSRSANGRMALSDRAQRV